MKRLFSRTLPRLSNIPERHGALSLPKLKVTGAMYKDEEKCLDNEIVLQSDKTEEKPCLTEYHSADRKRRFSDASIQSVGVDVTTDDDDVTLEKYLMLADELNRSLEALEEVKDITILYQLLISLLKTGVTTVETVLRFYTIQRCSSRKRIRDVVQRLTMEETSIALRFFSDTSLIVGKGLLKVQSQFRQTWIVELFRRLSRHGSPYFTSYCTWLQRQDKKAEDLVIIYDSMGKLYGKLTTVLDHQYRIQLKQNLIYEVNTQELSFQEVGKSNETISHEVDLNNDFDEDNLSSNTEHMDQNSCHSSSSSDQESDVSL